MSVLALASSQPSHEIDLDVQNVVLDVVNRKLRAMDARITASLVGGTLERTIEGASTLTLDVHDPKRMLLRSGLLEQQVQLRLDRLFWRLCQIQKSGDDLTLVFEDREVSLLRQHTKPKKAARNKMTRAEFALSLVREVKEGGGIPFVCPELHVTQPIESSKMEKTTTERKYNRDKGLARNVRLTVKGAVATSSQLRNAEIVLDVADTHGADERATLALMEAVIVESRITNSSKHFDLDSRGILQVRDSTARYMRPPLDNMDISQCCAAFLEHGFWGKGGAMELARKYPKQSAGWVAQQTQGSGHPERYDQYENEAQRFIDQYQGGSTITTTSTTKTVLLPFQFRRGDVDGKRETSWDALQRLAQDVQWRCFMSAGSLYFISEDQLMRARPRLVLGEDSPGVVSIDFDLDVGKPSSTATITARASRWVAAPGAVVQLDEDCGPAHGRWLVTSLYRGVFDPQAQIGLKRVTHKLREPAADTRQRTFTRRSAAMAATSGMIERAYRKAQQISAKRFPYVWGGGHAKAGVPSGSPPGYDCSGSVVAVLAAAGMDFDPGGATATSGTLMNWGIPGPGIEMTVYASPVHTFIQFTVGQGTGPPGQMKDPREHFGTGDWGSNWNGPGFKPVLHPIGYGFVARHWPGT